MKYPEICRHLLYTNLFMLAFLLFLNVKPGCKYSVTTYRNSQYGGPLLVIKLSDNEGDQVRGHCDGGLKDVSHPPVTPGGERSEVRHRGQGSEVRHRGQRSGTEVSSLAQRSEVRHKGQRSGTEVEGQAQRSEIMHRGRRSEVSHKGQAQRSEVRHRGQRSEVRHRGQRSGTEATSVSAVGGRKRNPQRGY